MTNKEQQIVNKYRKQIKKQFWYIYKEWLEHLTDSEFLKTMERMQDLSEDALEDMFARRKHVEI